MSNHTLHDLCRHIVGSGYDRAAALASGEAEPVGPQEQGIVEALREGFDTARSNTAAAERLAAERDNSPSQDPFAGLTADDQGRLA